jgi:hypothetical protein
MLTAADASSPLPKAKRTANEPMLIAEFNGRQCDGRKVTVERVRRLIAYGRNHGIIKVAK